MSDIFEEHERSAIRGTLISLAVSNAASAATRAIDLIDPYKREARIWLRGGMSKETIVAVVGAKIGLIEVKEDGDLIYFAPPSARGVIKLVINKETGQTSTGTGE